MSGRSAMLWALFWFTSCGGSSEDGESEAEAEAEAEGEGDCSYSCQDPVGSDDLCSDCSEYCNASNPCSLPNADVQANEGDDEDANPPLTVADYGCLGANAPPAPPEGDATITGEVEDRLTGNTLPNLFIEAFPASQSFDAACATTTSDAEGNYSIVLGASCFEDGDALVSWRVTDEVEEEQVPTLHLNQRVDCKGTPSTAVQNRVSFSETTVDVTAITLRATSPIAGTSIVIGDIVDCAGRSVTNANGRLYDASGKRITSLETYYFQEAFPRRRDAQAWTSPDGLVALIDVPAGAVVEIRGYGRIGGNEALLSSVRVPPLADSIVITDMEPLAE